MARRACSRRELLNRWREIQEDDEDDDPSPAKPCQIRKAKEEWFSDSFTFLANLPKESHIWCGYSDLMGPLLETFYNYFSDKRIDSPLKLMWKRISEELGQCTQCIFHHHQAQESYNVEYELDAVGPLLKVLQSLDEERVAEHIKEINARMESGDYDADSCSSEVVSIMFEVLSYPMFLEDRSLVNEFQVFLEAVDSYHDVTLADSQQYPGVYALLFFKSGRARAIGFRLAGCMGKLRNATDLDPLQPSLKKFIGFLETEVLPSTLDESRPRVQHERTTVWIGVKTLLGFLEAPAYEEGILERYPVFLSIVLNHVNGDTLDFSYAVACLRTSFEILGSKLWLRTALSPSVMRNTLLGQCFHTRNEKSHKEIFDLFLPFLQSLEAHRDGEHEKQRRNILYFLLHQVTQSSNFSDLMRKNACKIALLIIYRGYKMVPPSPPFECAHMWGPSLVNSLKNLSLHSSLRQPAFDLITTILVSDASSLISLKQMMSAKAKIILNSYGSFIDEEDELTFSEDVEGKDNSCWAEFNIESKLASSECTNWMCVPMLWLGALIEVGPASLPISFSKALFWVLSHISVVELNFSVDMSLSVRDWLSIHASEISSSFGWQTPTGSNDGGEGKKSQNSIKASSMCNTLLRALKRLAAEFIGQLEKLELHKQWSWEPRMSESLILSLVDPDDIVRKAGKNILEHLSNEHLLTSGLQFLCSRASSLSSMVVGLRFMFKQVHVYPIMDSFHSLHHVFFVTGKLLTEIVTSPNKTPSNPLEYPSSRTFSSQGGFLRQPSIDHSSANTSERLPNQVDIESWKKFSCLLAAVTWFPVLKCIMEGKELINNTNCQMTCVRLLETLPAIYEVLSLSTSKLSGSTMPVIPSSSDFKWLLDLVDWGRSLLVVIIRHWKKCLQSLLNIFKGSCNYSAVSTISTIEKIISTDTITIDNLQEQMLHLTASFSRLAYFNEDCKIIKPKLLPSECLSLKNVTDLDASWYFDSHLHSTVVNPNMKTREKEVIFLDDEPEIVVPPKIVALSSTSSSSHLLHEISLPAAVKGLLSDGSTDSITRHSKVDLLEPFPSGIFVEDNLCSSQEEEDDLVINKIFSDGESVVSRNKGFHMHERSLVKGVNNNLVKSSHKGPNIRSMNCQSTAEILPNKMTKTDLRSERKDAMIQELVRDVIDDPLELAHDRTSRPQPVVSKPTVFAPKRKVIQLQMPSNNKSSSLNGMDVSAGRLKPPKLDDWYKPILEMDFFLIVGLYSADEDEKAISNLREVPLHFQSPDHYVKIFRPLVLEEFKAQLHNSFVESTLEDMRCGSLCVVSVERIDDFHIIRACPDEKESAASIGCLENDLVLLTKVPLENSVQITHVLGKVERREKSDKKFSIFLVIRLYLPGSSPRLNKVKRLLIERSKWFLNRIMSITPQLREFQALSSLNAIPMLPIILNPVDHSLGCAEPQKVDLSKLSHSMQDILKSSFNGSQLQAISIAIKAQASRNFKLSLIQGPPGTGKTRTIVAMVSALLALHRAPRNYSSNVSVKTTREINASSNPSTQLSPSVVVARAWQDAAFAKQLIKDAEKVSSIPSCFASKGRVLICAQSNAAVDEIVSRINEGICGDDGRVYKPFIVRVGNAKSVHPNSLPFFIDTLVDLCLAEKITTMGNADGTNDSSLETLILLRAKLEKLVEKIQFYESKRANSKDDADFKAPSGGDISKEDDMHEMSDAAIGAKLNNLYREKKIMYQNLAAAQAREKNASEESRALKYKIRKSILREAEIVVTTLSGCGGDLYGVCYESASSGRLGKFLEHCFFDVVVIDEAAQALEPATLIPLQLLKSNGATCIMVGDPKQLPATVLSNVASKFLYEYSMFERLQRAGHPVILLTEQYRMHPEICSFPSLHFYDNKLINGIHAASKSAQFHEHSYLGPYVFFNITDGREHHGKGSGSLSLYNEAEVEAAISIMRFFRRRYPSDFTSKKIGIITPYKSQLYLLRSCFSKVFGASTIHNMEFNTVDGFQGREVDILVLTTVRSSISGARSGMSSSNGIGFVADVRRMNVALTRAKFSLWIVGSASTLQTNFHWAALFQNAKERNLFISVARPYDSFFERAASVSGGTSTVSTIDFHASHAKNHRTKYSCEVECDSSGGRDSNMKKTKHVGGKRVIHSIKTPRDDCVPDSSEGTKKQINDKHNKFIVVGGTVAHEDEAIKFQKQKNKLANSGNPLQKNLKCSGEGSKGIQENIQLGADSRVKAAIMEKALGKFSGHATSSKPCDNTRNLQSSEKAQREAEKEKSKPSDVKSTAKDLLATRKRQRDDIEALLPSSLISSKKMGMSSNATAIEKLHPRHNSKSRSKLSKI